MSRWSDGRSQNDLPSISIKKVALDAQAETQVNQVVQSVMEHLDKKKLTCPVETQKEIYNLLTNSGLKKIEVRRNDWPINREAVYFLNFSLDGTIVESKKIVRMDMAY